MCDYSQLAAGAVPLFLRPDTLVFNYPAGNARAERLQRINAFKIAGRAAVACPRDPNGDWPAVEQMSSDRAYQLLKENIEMLPTIHCSVPGCQSTCQLSSQDRNRTIGALKERGWAWEGETVAGPGKIENIRARCPTHHDSKFAAPVVPVEPVSPSPGAQPEEE